MANERRVRDLLEDMEIPPASDFGISEKDYYDCELARLEDLFGGGENYNKAAPNAKATNHSHLWSPRVILGKLKRGNKRSHSFNS